MSPIIRRIEPGRAPSIHRKAIYHARAVIAVLYEAVSPGEMADVRAH